MKKIKYFYNTHTLRYEKLVTPLRVKLLRLFGFLSGLTVASAIVIYLYLKFFPQPTDIEYRRKYELLKDNYNQVNEKVKSLQQQMVALEKRDNEVYRSIFEANPVPDSARAKLIEQQKEIEKIKAENAHAAFKIGDQIVKTMAETNLKNQFKLAQKPQD